MSRLQNKLVETKTDLRNCTVSQKLSPPETKTDLRNCTVSQKLSPPETRHLTAVRVPQGNGLVNSV